MLGRHNITPADDDDGDIGTKRRKHVDDAAAARIAYAELKR